MTQRIFVTAAALGVFFSAGIFSNAASLPDSLAAIRAVGPEGRGNVAASTAWRSLAAQDAGQLPALLAGMDGANELAMNWLRAAVESIAGREQAAGRALPLSALRTFLLDTSHEARARRLAFELIARAEPATADQLLNDLLDDPGAELRRDAVQKIIDQARAAETADKARGTQLYQKALASAREVDQVQSLTKKLRQLGQSTDVPRLFGFLTAWQAIGPFDNAGGVGFDTVFPPEKEINLTAEYPGKSGKVRWQNVISTNEYGIVDLNKPLGKQKGVTGYAFTEFVSDTARPAELRLGCKNAWKVWLNGKLLFSRDEYHRGMQIDQYRMPVQLQAGRNTILVKACQNEQVESWTVEWEFQLRVCDKLGTALLSATTPPAKAN
jgi:hypothetical protein